MMLGVARFFFFSLNVQNVHFVPARVTYIKMAKLSDFSTLLNRHFLVRTVYFENSPALRTFCLQEKMERMSNGPLLPITSKTK